MKNSPHSALVPVHVAVDLIASGVSLSVAGPEALLDQLPTGNWLGGTSSYFMADEGGVKSNERVFITRLPDEGVVTLAYYTPETLPRVLQDAPTNGFSFAIMPSGSEALRRFAAGCRNWEDILLKPIVGWVAGIDLAELGRQTPKIYNGRDGSKHTDVLIVAHVRLPDGRLASIETVNIFERDPRHVIRFPATAFEATDCTVNGETTTLAAFLVSHGNADGALPLIGDFGGASINVSVQSIDRATGRVAFYAPVFPDVEYYLAKPVGNYAARFAEELDRRANWDVAFSCNCILNFLHGSLEGKRTGALHGPVTFGEIAYMLHNQTMVILNIV